MGCSMTIIRPEHRILDSCIELGRLLSLGDEQSSPRTTNTSITSSVSSSRDLEHYIKEEFIIIMNITKSCDILPQYCLREVRHAVETLHFKKPEIAQKLLKQSETTINMVKQKTLGLSCAYTCICSPNEGILKLSFQNNGVSPSRHRVISTSTNPQQFIIDTSLHLVNPSKTPSPPRTPMTETSPSSINDSKSPNDHVRRASCPSPQSPTKLKYDRHQLEVPLSQRVRLRSIDGSDKSNIEYGFFHEDDNVAHC